MAGDKEIACGDGPTERPEPEKRAQIHHHRSVDHVVTAIRRQARSFLQHRIWMLFPGE
jgi:hypothetical protein